MSAAEFLGWAHLIWLVAYLAIPVAILILESPKDTDHAS